MDTKIRKILKELHKAPSITLKYDENGKLEEVIIHLVFDTYNNYQGLPNRLEEKIKEIETITQLNGYWQLDIDRYRINVKLNFYNLPF